MQACAAIVETVETTETVATTRQEAAARLIPLARRIGRRLAMAHGRGQDLSEIEGAAQLGLADALSRFDPTRAEIFPAYAAQRIRGAVMDELRRRDPRSRYSREQRNHVRRVSQDLELESGSTPSEARLAGALGTTVDKMREVMTAGATIRLVPLPESDDQMQTALVGEVPHSDPFAACARAEILTRVASALDQLEARDHAVLHAYFFQEKTLAQIAAGMGITEARVSQLVTRAVARLREKVGGILTLVVVGAGAAAEVVAA